MDISCHLSHSSLSKTSAHVRKQDRKPDVQNWLRIMAEGPGLGAGSISKRWAKNRQKLKV